MHCKGFLENSNRFNIVLCVAFIVENTFPLIPLQPFSLPVTFQDEDDEVLARIQIIHKYVHAV